MERLWPALEDIDTYEGGFQPSQSALPLGDRRWRRLLGFGSLYGFKNGYWLVVIGRTGSGLPGVAKESPCFEHLERPCTRASRPRKKSLAVAPAVPSEMIMGRATQPAFGGAIRCRVGLAQLLDGGRSN
jgi:hypothetical protein